MRLRGSCQGDGYEQLQILLDLWVLCQKGEFKTVPSDHRFDTRITINCLRLGFNLIEPGRSTSLAPSA
jgi:hypothetical protein